MSQGFVNRLNDWTLSLWFNAAQFRDQVLYSEGNPSAILNVSLTAAGQLAVSAYNQNHNVGGTKWATTTTVNAPVRSNHWHHLTATYTGGSDTNGTIRLLLDDFVWQASGMHRVSQDGAFKTVIGAQALSASTPDRFFQGRLDEVRLWSVALSEEQVRSNRYLALPATRDDLLASFPFNEGQGDILHNVADGYDGTAINGPTWCYGQTLPVGRVWAEFPGFIHQAEGDRYNVNRYRYPTEAEPGAESYVFGVNTGGLEVWWANPSRWSLPVPGAGMPAVYYPSRVVRYANVWPDDPPQIVIASGLGTSGNSLLAAEDALYFNGTATNYVSVPNHPALDVGNEVTVEAWVNLSNPAGNNKVVCWRSSTGGNTGCVLGVYTNAVDVEFFTGSGTARSFFGQPLYGTVPSNAWTHIAYTFKANTTNSVVTYVNGLPAYTNVAAINEGIRPSTTDLYIGRASYNTSLNTKGSIGEVRIWNVARSPEQIAGAWRTRLNGDEPGLVACYPFVRGTDTNLLADAGPFGLAGTISGATWANPGRPVSVPGPLGFGSPSIYSQNSPALPGYNPNEEHALMLDNVAYALRNDLNATETSAPFVLLDYLDPVTARPAMQAFGVLTTNELYAFDRDLTAGLPILPTMPLGAMPLCSRNYSETLPPAWQDRKLGWWAVSAGDDGGTADALMHFYYPMQPTFCFPALAASAQPAIGVELPWLPDPSDADYASGIGGAPRAIPYHIAWPIAPPELKLGQTLTLATKGLPDIWNQLSVAVEYDQSRQTGGPDCVTLFDPLVDFGANLDRTVINSLQAIALARQDSASPLIRFPNLPPSLYPRLYYDPNRGAGGQLVLEGRYVSTLTGGGYLLLNLLEGFEKEEAKAMASGLEEADEAAWAAAIDNLPGDLALIEPNTPYAKAALGARLASGVGYVTLAFNNSRNADQVPPALPVSLSVIRVVPELYSGALEVLMPDDALAEQLSLRYGADLAGEVAKAEFQWRWIEPSGGLVPNTNYFTAWKAYPEINDPAAGINEVSLSGASPFTLSDHYFAVRYRAIDPTGPAGTNWSDWTDNLAPGWVKRAMTGINPFEQVFHDMTASAVDTRVTMISQAGGPYEGDVALNLDAASSAGLIATYQTIFNRAKNFSLEAGLSSADLNQTMLFAASRLHDLYTLLGNEAYADAQDPTLAFPRSLAEDQHGADATSIFPFMNQVPNLLEEELALLRGRDDTLAPSVHTSPIYNRLIWNYTQGINGGEPAYAYNYNIRGTPTNTVGLITVEDAKRFYPQGHGDAWGHYLSALSGYYDLLSYTNFVWHTEPEATLLGNAAVSTDYFDEQKFAETAAARARTGAEIVKQTFRQRYAEDPTGRWPGYTDTDSNRAWGIGDWASRAGQAALYDWAVANSLLVDRLTNMVQVGGGNRPPEGIQKIDRDSTPELDEIARTFKEIQSQVDSADGGLNPLGLARNVVPFDIDPAAIDAGKTHFEQIHDRALQALRNACVAFDHARNATLRLREQSDSTYDLAAALAANETDYHNRLVQIYGYPYADDIGVGKTYPTGYDGPDLINWQILDLENLLANAPTGQVMQVQVYNLNFSPGTNTFTSTNYQDYLTLPSEATRSTNLLGTVSVCMADNGLKVKPSDWTGRRRAEGELQHALSDFVQTWYALEARIAEYNKALSQLEVDLERQQGQYSRYTQEWQENVEIQEAKQETARIIEGLKATKTSIELVAKTALELGFIISGFIPQINTGITGPFPTANTGFASSTAAKVAVYLGTIGTYWVSRGMELGIDARTMQQSVWEADLAKMMTDNNYKGLLKWNTRDTLVKLQDQYVKQAELFAKVQALSQSYERVQKLLASGEQLIFQRGQVRARAAQRIQSQRYADLDFRIFRNDALRRYQAAFDLAARYTYLAAKAYDYETGLLRSDTARTPGSQFLEDVVRARLPGRFYVWLGTPMVGGPEGEPGLADILARMKGDWDVVKGRHGFNNPDTETSRFSLRSELWRIAPSSSSDATWAQALENCRVADLRELPEFIRYCRPYNDTTNAEPALVIPFSTFVVAGKNYFGHDLAGGDNAYDASHAATKIRSAGIWFTGYNGTFNPDSTGGGLANEPRVYLIPVGEDVMRSPTRNAVETRSWTVLDQAIPLPYNVGGAEVDSPDWIPVLHSLREPLAKIRRYASLRAYHDNGQFDEAETHNNARLVGRSVWNTGWLLIIPARTLLADPEEGLERFIHGAGDANGSRDGNGIKDIKIFFQTYSISGD